MKRQATLVFALLLAGCAVAPREPAPPTAPQPRAVPGMRYEAEPGREAAVVAQLRAGPAPAQAEFVQGGNPRGDRSRLAAQGLLPIGTGRFEGDAGSAHEAALEQARRVGADRIVWYAAGTDPAQAEPFAVFYVRFRLPFGATFRDLRPAERERAGGGGVAIGAVVGGTPASRANLRPGDLVIACNQERVADRAAFQALLRRHAGHAVTLSLVRNGERLRRVVRLGAMPDR
jgi:hypothetical protein